MAELSGNELPDKLEKLRSVCGEAEALLVEAGIRNLFDSCYLDLAETAFLSLIVHERPSAVFFEAVAYEPDPFIRGTMISEGWRESWEHDPNSIWPTPDDVKTELRTDLESVANQIGLPRSLMATYAIAGQNRVCWLTTEWSEELSDKIVKILDERHERAEKAAEQIARELESLIVEIADDPGFRAIRGRPKRLLFIQKKYGDRVPVHPRGKMMQPAQNCEYVDMNLGTVLVKADERVWLDTNLSD
ncbi:hypothetical protein [uncultured Castellaniella sp.]|uniref:hypothetical protein n=1 Tax=uncultured Castellaniella sp. TaxID=647907 RepID=UPI00260A15F7|nr:hypothetical protein [uncultured Castellaniella sp.]